MKRFLQVQTIKLTIVGLLSIVSMSVFAQTNVTLNPACQSCPPSATLNSSVGTPVPTPVPSCGTVAGTYKVGTALTAANTITLSFNVVTAGGYTISTPANGMTFTGTGTFAGTGTQSVVLTGSGTPLKAETTAVMVQYGGSTCSAAVIVASNAPTAVAPPVGAVNGGSLGGKTCFDVAISNDNTNGCALLSSRTPQKADFTLATTNTQIYTFTPRGTVSNVRFSYVNTNGDVITALVGGNTGNNITTAVTATATFNAGLNAPATGLTNSNPLTADIYCVYNDGATNNGVDRQVKITPYVKDCACCGAWVFPDADPTLPKVWLEFMCHNLGADETLDPFKYHPDILGDLYQWGRPTDGHQKRNSESMSATSSYATTNIPNHPYFIAYTAAYSLAGPQAPWTNSTIIGWGDGFVKPASGADLSPFSPKKGNTDPCPDGWKLPSFKQMAGMFIGKGTGEGGPNGYAYLSSTLPKANIITEVFGPRPEILGNGFNVGNLLYLPYAGSRNGVNASADITNTGVQGVYITVTSHTFNTNIISGSLELASGGGIVYYRPQGARAADGRSIRCVIDK